MSLKREEIVAGYQKEIEKRKELVRKLEVKISNLSPYQFFIFVFEIYMFGTFVSKPLSIAGVVLILSPMVAFIVLLKYRQKFKKEVEFNKSLMKVLENEINVIAGGDNVYSDGECYKDNRHLNTSDLDVFGKQSLFALINRCSTGIGQDLLFKTLSSNGNKKRILDRQQAIEEVTTHIHDICEFRAHLIKHDNKHFELIQKKIENINEKVFPFTNSSILSKYVAIFPYISLISLLISIVFGGWFWLIPLSLALINLAVSFMYVRRTTEFLKGFELIKDLLTDYSFCIKWINKINWTSAYLIDLTRSNGDKNGLTAKIRKLDVILSKLNISNQLLNLFCLWDLSCAFNLAKWHLSSSADFLNGLVIIGEFEELISFSTLNYNNPDWCTPVLNDQFCLKAISIGHPLISLQTRVYNDFAFSNMPTVDIITGSNMAGKSTFLRTIGINTILAYSGANVCARKFEVSIFNIVTYMRIADSINNNTSTFKAELNRIKLILDQIKSGNDNLIIVDEMLRGTNSYDKYVGSKAFVEKLAISENSVLFATHDIQLSELKLGHSIRNFHLDMTMVESDMIFDYKIKDGACRVFNAEFLLKEIGLLEE